MEIFFGRWALADDNLDNQEERLDGSCNEAKGSSKSAVVRVSQRLVNPLRESMTVFLSSAASLATERPSLRYSCFNWSKASAIEATSPASLHCIVVVWSCLHLAKPDVWSVVISVNISWTYPSSLRLPIWVSVSALLQPLNILAGGFT